jgi:hypothetical protein
VRDSRVPIVLPSALLPARAMMADARRSRYPRSRTQDHPSAVLSARDR